MTKTIVLVGESDIFMLYMSCMREALRASGCEVSLDELDILLPAIDTARILSVALRDVDYEISLYEPHAYLSTPPPPAPREIKDLRKRLVRQAAANGHRTADFVEVPREFFQRIMIVSSRYAVGSMTYIVGWQASMIEAAASRGELDESTRRWISHYIMSRDQNADGHQLGADFDRHRWVQCAKSLDVWAEVE